MSKIIVRSDYTKEGIVLENASAAFRKFKKDLKKDLDRLPEMFIELGFNQNDLGFIPVEFEGKAALSVGLVEAAIYSKKLLMLEDEVIGFLCEGFMSLANDRDPTEYDNFTKVCLAYRDSCQRIIEQINTWLDEVKDK